MSNIIDNSDYKTVWVRKQEKVSIVEKCNNMFERLGKSLGAESHQMAGNGFNEPRYAIFKFHDKEPVRYNVEIQIKTGRAPDGYPLGNIKKYELYTND